MVRVKSSFLLAACLLLGLFLSACQSKPAVSVEDKIANAISAGPPEIAQEATIMDYPKGWPGNWPKKPAPELVVIRSGSNGWTCLPDRPDTPGNDPLCMNETFIASLKAQYAKTDPPSTGIGVGYMLQGGGPVGSPPHMMVFAPRSIEDLAPFSTKPGTLPWNMNAGTANAHLMLTMIYNDR